MRGTIIAVLHDMAMVAEHFPRAFVVDASNLLLAAI